MIPGSFQRWVLDPGKTPSLLVASLSCAASMARAASCAGVVLDAGALTRNTAVRLCVLCVSSAERSSEPAPALARKARSSGSASTSSSRIASPSLCLSPSIDIASSTDTGEKVPSRDRAVDDSLAAYLAVITSSWVSCRWYAVNALFRLASTSTHAIPDGDWSANAAPGSGRRMDTATNDGSRSASAERMRLVNASKPAMDRSSQPRESLVVFPVPSRK